MASIEQSIEVDVSLRTAYNQWTQFEAFPRFIEEAHAHRQLEGKRFEWRAEILGRDVRWCAENAQQIPDQRIRWKSTSGAWNAGAVSFVPVTPTRTRVTLRMEYEPESLADYDTRPLGLVSRRVESDLRRFKVFIEDNGAATDAWRGEIHGQDVA